MHIPVLTRELLELLALNPGGIFVDGTLGAGGHAAALLESADYATLIGIDKDGEILKMAQNFLQKFGKQVRFRQGNFCDIKSILSEEGIDRVDGIYLDLGVSSFQIDRAERGFSFMKEGPIDMRMDDSFGLTVLEKIEKTNETELTRVLREFGEERYAYKIACGILEKLGCGKLNTTLDLAAIAIAAYPLKQRHRGIHPATRTFQALRIWVNAELESLQHFLSVAPSLLKKEGRLCVVSYHSLEDRLVKHRFRNLTKENENFKVVTKKPITPSEGEIMKNPRSRSAKLRGLVRLA